MTTIKIGGMSCQHCVRAVAKALGSIEGITDVQVDLEKGEASFREKIPQDSAVIKEVIKRAGYEVL